MSYAFDSVLDSIFSGVAPKREGDLADRVNYSYTTSILIFAAVFAASTYFGSPPINCWFPPYFKGFWIEYANDYCFVQSTYFLRFTEGQTPHLGEVSETLFEEIPRNLTQRTEKVLPYYQWVPFFLAMQAFLFYVPFMLWRVLSNTSGLFVNTILMQASSSDNVAPAQRKMNMDRIAKYIDYAKIVYASMRTQGFLTGRYIVTLYMFVKVLYCINCVGQFFLMNAFLGFGSYSWWGVGILSDLLHGRSWMDNGRFPRVTLCDFEVRDLGAVHSHTVQCTLYVNMYNEKIFLLLWWWFFFVSIMTVLNTINWIFLLAFFPKTKQFVSTYLKKIDSSALDPHESGKIDRFARKFLMPDGVLLLRLIATNAGDLICADLLDSLWKLFKEKDHIDSESSPASTDRSLRSGGTDEMTPLRPPKYDDTVAKVEMA